jgi:hypothetical protein
VEAGALDETALIIIASLIALLIGSSGEKL